MAKKKRSSQHQQILEGPEVPITIPDRNPTPSQHHNPAVPQPQATAIRNSIGYPMSNQNIVVTGPAELVQAEHQAYQTASFFPSSSGFNVSGGQFSSYRDHHTTGNVFINVNPGSRDNDSVEIRTRSTGRMGTRVPPGDSDVYPQAPDLETGYPQGPTRDSPHRDNASSFSGPSQISNTAHQHSSLEQPIAGPSVIRQQARISPLPVQKSSEIYYRHLSILGRGSPLWIPEPSNTLPMEYQRAGIGIGDVGILVDSGGFDFLFNIYQPPNDSGHPINPRTLPEGFCALDPPEENDMSSHVEFKNNSFLASSLVNSRRDGASPGLIFESSASDGAILTMPNGANSKDLENKTIFRKYVRLNAQRWYTYANEVRGRDARNGDIRLVVGKTSTTTWGMATFANHSEQSAFRLEFKPTNDGGANNLGASYTWEHSGIAEVKFGPDAHEVEKLRNGDHQADCPTEYENQSLFIRTINVTLQDDVWKRLTEQWELLDLDDDENPTSNPESNSSFLLGSSTTGSLATPVAGGSGSYGSTSGTTMNLAGNLVPEDHAVSQYRRPRGSVHLSAFPPPLSVHPSKVINDFLLAQIPEAKMAITEDNDWISVLEKSDVALPEPDVLISRIIDLYEICIEEDVLFLRVRDPDLLPGRRTRSYTNTPFVPPPYDIEDFINTFEMPEPEAGFSDEISTSTNFTDFQPLEGSQTKYKEKLQDTYGDEKLSASKAVGGKPSLRPINRLAITYKARPHSNPWTKPKALTFDTKVTLFEFDPQSAANSMPHKSRIHENELRSDTWIFDSGNPSKGLDSKTSLNETTLSPPPRYSPNWSSPSLILPPPSPPKKIFEKFSEINISANQDEIQIHFLLAYTPDSTPPVHFDLSFAPPHFLPTEHLQSLSEPATSPAQPTLIIKYPSGLKNEIVVTSQIPNPWFVSVHDVLSGLYQDLCKPVTAHEYMGIEDRKTREEISNTYYSRCWAIKNLAERRQQEQRGLRRIDLLMGKNRFLGLSATTIGANVWVINVATLSPN